MTIPNEKERMGISVSLENDKGEILQVELFSGGSDLIVNEIESYTKATINVTFNYSWFFFKFLDEKDGITMLNGLKASDGHPKLQKMLDELNTKGIGNGEINGNEGYWTPTPYNVAVILKILIRWCEQHPEGIFITD